MAEKKISDYLGNARLQGAAAQSHLRQLVERYPYFHAAHILYLRSLHQNHDATFGQELRRTALYVPSREVIYTMLEGQRLNPARYARPQGVRPKNAADDDAPDRTESLIGRFLDTVSEPRPRRVQKQDATVDYLEFLRQSEADSEVFAQPAAAAGGDVIDRFLQGEKKFNIHGHEDDELLVPREREETEGESGVLTEMMAKIYIKQGKYEKAYEIISRLSLKNPKKNRYFADQMRFLQKIIINNNNK